MRGRPRPLEEKLAWMRERQRRLQAAEACGERAKPLSPAVHERRTEVEPPSTIPRMLRVEEAARILGVSKKTIRRAFRKHAVKLLGCVLIPEKVITDALRRP